MDARANPKGLRKAAILIVLLGKRSPAIFIAIWPNRTFIG